MYVVLFLCDCLNISLTSCYTPTHPKIKDLTFPSGCPQGQREHLRCWSCVGISSSTTDKPFIQLDTSPFLLACAMKDLSILSFQNQPTAVSLTLCAFPGSMSLIPALFFPFTHLWVDFFLSLEMHEFTAS